MHLSPTHTLFLSYVHLSRTHIHASNVFFHLSIVRISAILAVYGDGTIAPFNVTITARRQLLRTQIGIQVNYYVTTVQSQEATKALLTQDNTRAAMTTALTNAVPTAVLSFPRFGDTDRPSFAPTPVPTVKVVPFTLGALVAVCVVGGSLCIGCIVALVTWGAYKRMKYNVEYLEPVVINYVEPPPPSSPGSPQTIDLERGDGLFRRPRLVQMVHQNTQTMVNQQTQTDNDDDTNSHIKEDDSDKDSEFSSICISVTEEVILASTPSTMLFNKSVKSSVIGVSSDESGKSKSKSKGGKSSVSKSTVLLVPNSAVETPPPLVPEVTNASTAMDVIPTTVVIPNVPLFDEDNGKGKNDMTSLKVDARPATYNATIEKLTTKKKTFQTLELTENENSSINKVERPPALNIHDAFKDLFCDDVPLPPPRSTAHPAGVLPPKSLAIDVPSQSQKSIDYASPIPRISVNFQGLESGEEDNSGRKGNHDDYSLLYRNDEEDPDLHLSAVYKQHTGWEDEDGMILSTNPAWLKLLDGDSITVTIPPHDSSQDPPSPDSNNLPVSAGTSSSSVRMSGKSYEGDEGKSRRKQSFMTVDSDVVAVKAGKPSSYCYCPHSYTFFFH